MFKLILSLVIVSLGWTSYAEPSAEHKNIFKCLQTFTNIGYRGGCFDTDEDNESDSTKYGRAAFDGAYCLANKDKIKCLTEKAIYKVDLPKEAMMKIKDPPGGVSHYKVKIEEEKFIYMIRTHYTQLDQSEHVELTLTSNIMSSLDPKSLEAKIAVDQEHRNLFIQYLGKKIKSGIRCIKNKSPYVNDQKEAGRQIAEACRGLTALSSSVSELSKLSHNQQPAVKDQKLQGLPQ